MILSFENENFAIIDKGRNDSENSFILVYGGKYAGYGYFEQDQVLYSLQDLKELILPLNYFHDSNSIIKQFMKANPKLKIITNQNL